MAAQQDVFSLEPAVTGFALVLTGAIFDYQINSQDQLQKSMKDFFPNLEELEKQQAPTKKKRKRKTYKL